MRPKPVLALSLALSFGMVATACAEDQPAIGAGGGGEEAGHEDEGEGHSPQGTREIGGEEAAYHGSTDLLGSSDFQLELDDFYFGPTVLEGDAGQELALGLFNDGGVPHTFTIDGVVDEELPSGVGGIEIEVTFPDSGAVVFYCRFHRGQGMLGALSVEGSLETSGSGGMTSDGSPRGPDYDYG